MRFENPYLLNLLWLLFPVAGILAYGIWKRKKILSAFADTDMLPAIIPGFAPGRRWIKTGMILLAAACSIVAVTGPQAGYRWETVRQQGVDIMIALDCSKSMLAQDIRPNRLERAKREIVDLLRMAQSDRIGLVAFSGTAILKCPLTLDRDAFNIFLDVLEPGFLPRGGSNLAAAVETAYAGFEMDTDTEKAIILITDGEHTQGDADAAAQQMAEAGIKIFCIGVGDLQGAPIPDQAGGFVKDDSGNIVLSRVDETGLKRIADVTGGIYVRSVAGDMDLDVIYTEHILGGMEKTTVASGRKKIWENWYQWFLFPGLVLLLVELFLSPMTRSKQILPVILAGVLFAQAPMTAKAQSVSRSVRQGIEAFENHRFEAAEKHFIDAQLEEPDDARLYFNIGTAAYMAENFEQAEKNFEQAARSNDPVLRQNAQYNLANTHYHQGRLDEAIKGYEELLKEFPEDIQAKENLEFVKKKQQEQQEEQRSKPDQKQGRDNDKSETDPSEAPNSDAKPGNEDQQGRQQNQKDGENTEQPEDEKSSGRQKNGEDRRPDHTDNSGWDRQTPPPPIPDPKAEVSDDTAGQTRGQSGSNQPVEQMLNRLEDRPGRAMIPLGQEAANEKDW